MKFLLLLCFVVGNAIAAKESAYQFLKKKSQESKPQATFNEYEDIISGSLAFVVGNIGYFTTQSNTLKIAYSGVQTVGIIGVGHGIYDYYYPHFDSRLLELLSKKQMTRGELADGYVALLGEIERAKRVSILWSSSLLTVQYGLNAFISKDVPSDMKDIYLFLSGVNAIVAAYSYFHVSDYEQYYLRRQEAQLGFIFVPTDFDTKAGLALTWTY